MAANVLFKKISRASFDALLTKDNGTLYRVIETDLTESFYQGSNKLNNANDAATAIAAISGSATIASETNGVVTIKAGVAQSSGAIANDSGTDIVLAKVATTGDAEDISFDNTSTVLSSTDVQSALEEIATASAGGVGSKTVYLEDASASQSTYGKVYNLYQGADSTTMSNNTLVGTINIPKDLFIKSASVETVVTADTPYIGAAVGDKYIDIEVQNQTDHIYVPVNALVDVYTVEANATQVQLAIDANNEISATIVAGSIDTTELAAGAVTHAKLATDAVEAANIKDGEVTYDKLSSTVQTSLGKADSAVQSVTASDPTTGTNGTITVDGTEVAVKGLGTAAFTATSAYDVAGSATTAENNAKAYADGLLTWVEVSSS